MSAILAQDTVEDKCQSERMEMMYLTKRLQVSSMIELCSIHSLASV